jgi:hypothetical protein
MDIQSALSAFGSVTMDWVILLVLGGLAAFDAYRNGTGRACAILLALPPALLLHELLPKGAFIGNITSVSMPIFDAFLFLVLAGGMYMLVRRMDMSYGTGSLLSGAIAGIAVAGALTVVWLEVPALDAVWHFGEQVRAVFSEGYRLWWLLGAFLAVAFVRS